MAFAATADPIRFEEAIAWFQSRFPLTQELKDALQGYAGARAWTIAGVAQLDIVLDVYAELLDAIENGTPLDEFRERVRSKLTFAWGHYDSARIETIFRTNLQKAFNAGRWQQIRDPDIRALRPFLMFDAIMDSRTSEICKAREGTVLPQDDPYWQSNNPPLHHRCRSQLRALSEREAKGKEIGVKSHDHPVSEGFGKAPDLEPPWQPDMNEYPGELASAFVDKRKPR